MGKKKNKFRHTLDSPRLAAHTLEWFPVVATKLNEIRGSQVKATKAATGGGRITTVDTDRG